MPRIVLEQEGVFMRAAYLQQSSIARSPTEVEALAAARTETLSRAGVHRKAIGLVVHGIGEQSLGSTLETIVNEFHSLVRTIDSAASIAVTPLDEGDPHEAKLWFRATDETDHGEYVYEIRFVEVWWAQAFQSPSVGEFLKGTIQFVWGHFKRIGNKKFRFLSDTRYWGPALWQRAIVELLIIPLLVAALALLIVARVSQWIVPKDKLPTPVVTARRVIVNAATRHLGDMWVYMGAPWEASQIRVRFEERFRQVIQLMEKPDPNNPVARVDSVFVIAHSMGSVVAYEALTGCRMTELLEAKFASGTGPEFHFISVGSALNWAWDIAPPEERFRFHRQLHHRVKWLNLWSGPDPVARGPLSGPSLKPGDCNRDRGRWESPTEQRIADADCMVVNQSDIFSDHSGYWNNAEEVIAPILDRITKGALSERLSLNRKARARRVGVLAWFKLLALVVALSIGFAAVFTGVDGWLIDQMPNDVLGFEADWLKREVLSPAVVSVALGIIAAVLYSSVVAWLWDRWDRSVKYKR